MLITIRTEMRPKSPGVEEDFVEYMQDSGPQFDLESSI